MSRTTAWLSLDKIEGGGIITANITFLRRKNMTDMKKKCNRKIRLASLMLAVIMVLTVIAPAPTVEAASKPSVAKSYTCTVQPSGAEGFWMDCYNIKVKNFPKGATIKSIKSSNKKVVSYYFVQGSNVWFCPNKAGKTVISFKVVNKGKSTTLKTKVTVKKYQRPCSSFKVGSKEYASKFKKEAFYYGKKPLGKKKISVKAAKGWTVSSISVSYGDNTAKKIRNKSYITFSANSGLDTQILVKFKNKKTKAYQMVLCQLH